MAERQVSLARCRKLRGRLVASLCVLIIFLVAPGYRVEAAELEGFGAIKFGMTKEEAFAALGGDGEWIDKDWFQYTMRLRSDEPSWSVQQRFDDGRASYVAIDYSGGSTPRGCIARSQGLAAGIEYKHGVIPVHRTVRHGDSVDLGLIAAVGRDVIEDFHVFAFDHGAYIRMHVTSASTPDSAVATCSVSILYAPPALSPVPF